MKVAKKNSLYLLATFAAVFWALNASLGAEKTPVKDKVALVNGVPITLEDFNREVNYVQLREFKKRGSLTDAQLKEIKTKVLKSLINRELIFQASQKEGIEIPQKDLSEKIKAVKKQFPDESAFNKALQSINLSVEQFKAKLKRGMIIEKFVNQKFSEKVEIEEDDVKAYYSGHPDLFKQPERVRARHILIRVAPQAAESEKEEARAKLEKIKNRIQAGEDFASLAKAFSEGPSKERGGDLGFFQRGQMVKPFEEAAFSLKPGEVSDIVKTRFGFHLIMVIDKKPAGKIGFDDIKDRLTEYLKKQEVQKQLVRYLDELRKRARVEKFLPGDN